MTMSISKKELKKNGLTIVPDGVWFGVDMANYKSFIDDKEKMRDFYILSKQEFLQSYSYLTELEYDLTVQEQD